MNLAIFYTQDIHIGYKKWTPSIEIPGVFVVSGNQQNRWLQIFYKKKSTYPVNVYAWDPELVIWKGSLYAELPLTCPPKLGP